VLLKKSAARIFGNPTPSEYKSLTSCIEHTTCLLQDAHSNQLDQTSLSEHFAIDNATIVSERGVLITVVFSAFFQVFFNIKVHQDSFSKNELFKCKA
jgi:hypothetical protein